MSNPIPRPLAGRPLITVTDTVVQVLDTAFITEHPSAWEALNRWCELHDIDPHRVLLCSRIVRNVEACRVEYDQVVLGCDLAKATVRDGDNLVVMTWSVHSQGETPPMPWPPEVWEAAR